MSYSFTLPKWYDLHTHLRQDDLLKPVIQSQLDMGCCGVLAMPNTKPPVAKIHADDPLPYLSLEEYRSMIKNAGGAQFTDFITPLYLTKDTTPEMIEEGAKSGLLKAVKYYPPHGTTGASFSHPLEKLLKSDVVKALEEHNIVMCVHGEVHGLEPSQYFDRQTNAEELFYQDMMPRIIDEFPDLRIVGEHITTKMAVDLVTQADDNVKATVTPQHLIYTVGNLLQGLKYHLYCLPLVKFDEDRDALRKAVTDHNNSKFFAGTDSAPHTKKATECGCAAGCFTGGVAPQLYAEAFEMSGLDLSLKDNQMIYQKFLCDIGQQFYGLEKSGEYFTLTKQETGFDWKAERYGDVVSLPEGMGRESLSWSLKIEGKDVCAVRKTA